MSEEGKPRKKRRGISGASNAKNIAFRYGGRPCDYSTKVGNPRSKYGNGTRLVGAVLLGSMLPGFSPSDRLATMVDAAISRCTHPLHKYD